MQHFAGLIMLCLQLLASDGTAPRDSSNIVLVLGDKGVFIAVAVVDCLCILMAFGLLVYINLHRDHRFFVLCVCACVDSIILSFVACLFTQCDKKVVSVLK